MAGTIKKRAVETGRISNASAATFLLGVGALAAPLFVGATLAQSLLRDDVNLMRDPISALSLGTYGWIHMACFIFTGIFFGFAVIGVNKVLGTRTTVENWLIVASVGFYYAGIFVTDAPNQRIAEYWDIPYDSTPHGWTHVFFSALTFIALAEAAKSQRHESGRWGKYSFYSYVVILVTAVLALIAFMATPAPLVPFGGLLQRTSNAVGLTWVSAFCLRLMPRRNNSII